MHLEFVNLYTTFAYDHDIMISLVDKMSEAKMTMQKGFINLYTAHSSVLSEL